jgi:RNA 2',3'-cyclic 3'-phosphodiesterase
LRTFIAIDIPEFVRSTVAGLQEHLKRDVAGVRWVNPENIHLTLKFLGDVHGGDLVRIQNAMAQAAGGVRPFSLSTAGIGAFPGLNRPRVIWVGIDGQTDALQSLNRRLLNRLAAAGFNGDKRKFSGHLTIGRGKGNVNPVRLIDSIRAVKAFSAKMFRVDRFILFKSDIRPTGAVYTALYQQALKE